MVQIIVVIIGGKLLLVFEFLANFIRHFYIFKHYFEALSKRRPALFLEFGHHGHFSFVAERLRLKKSLCERIHIKAFKDVFIEEISEDLDDPVNLIVNFNFVHSFKFLFKHFVEVENERARRAITLIHHVFESPL